MKRIILLGAASTLAGCAAIGEVGHTVGTTLGVTQGPVSAAADLRGAAGHPVGRAVATQAAVGTRIAVQIAGLAPGTYGAHIHATGRCDGPDFTSAGGHWNPLNREHGSQNPQGPHFGDLPNLVVGADGRGSITHVIPAAYLVLSAAPIIDQDGAALVVHAGPDDYRTDPSGNSGARIACGVLAVRP